MKKYLISVLAACSLAPSLFGLINVGEGQINLNLFVSSFYDSEIRARSESQEDFVFSVRPSLVYTRASRKFDISASVGLNSVTYMDFSQFDDTDVFFDLNISPSARMETSRFVFSGDIILNSETRTEDSVGEIITTRNYGVSAKLVYDPNRHYTLTGALGYTQRDPDSDDYNDTKSIEASLAVQKPINKNVALSGSIGLMDTNSDGQSTDSKTYTYSAGLTGNLFPKVTGSFSGGIQNRSFDSTREDITTPYVAANLGWQINERSSVNLTASQGLGTTIDDRSSEDLALRVTMKHSLSRDLSLSLHAGYEEHAYDSVNAALSRTDEDFLVGGSLTYQLVRYGSIGLDIQYTDRSSLDSDFETDRLRTGLIFKGSW